MSKLTTNKTELIKPNLWANKLDNKPIKKAWLAQEFRGVEMSNFNQPCGNYLSLFYKSSLSSSLSVFLSYRFFTNNQSEPPQKEREKKTASWSSSSSGKNLQWGLSSSHSKINSPLVCLLSLFLIFFFFPAETKCTQILIGLCFFCLLDGADERLKESSNIIAKYPDRVPVSLFKCP